MECYLAVKINEVLTYATTWMTLESIMLMKEASPKRPYLYNSIYTKCPEQKVVSGCQDLGEGQMGSDC